MEIQTSQQEHYHTIHISGDLDASSSIPVDMAIREFLQQGQVEILLINCRGLAYISSAGLGVFMSYLNEFEQKKIGFALFGMSPKVYNVFEILGLDQLMLLCANEQEALEKIHAL